jgi:hypothetical protein
MTAHSFNSISQIIEEFADTYSITEDHFAEVDYIRMTYEELHDLCVEIHDSPDARKQRERWFWEDANTDYFSWTTFSEEIEEEYGFYPDSGDATIVSTDCDRDFGTIEYFNEDLGHLVLAECSGGCWDLIVETH